MLIVWRTEKSLMVLSFHGVLGIELNCVKLRQQTLYQQSHPRSHFVSRFVTTHVIVHL